jgi:hypothetical protein
MSWKRLTAMGTAAAVVLFALLALQIARLENRTDHLSRQVTAMSGQPTMVTVKAALAVPGAHRVVLRPLGRGQVSLDAVMLPSGQSYLYDSTLTPLSSSQTYQLWGLVGNQKVSYGILGSAPPAVIAFEAGTGVDALAITAEVAGGVVASTHSPVVFGSIS